jgi:hypothetical protein
MVIGFVFALAISRAQAQLVPPPQASGAGFSNLRFDEEFQTLPDIGFGTAGHKWNANMWWKPVPPEESYVMRNGIFTIIGCSCDGVDLCTQYHDFSGGTYFQGGYFEARMRCTDWSAFWLFCKVRPFGNPVLAGEPLTWTNEIDIIETDPGSPKTAFCTLHANSSADGGVPDTLNEPHSFLLQHQLIGRWHTYGLLWTQSQISWYVDNVKIASTTPFPSTWQPVQLILGVGPGGVNGSASTVVPPVTQVEWVRVWEK